MRNRSKIEGAIASARVWLEIQEKGDGFSNLLWGHLDGRPKVNMFKTTKSVPAETPLSKAMSKDLAARGFKFVGPTIVYAFMQAVGMVNDHLVTCHRHAECQTLTKAPALICRRKNQKPLPHARKIAPARLAAHAVGPPARSARPLAARCGDRRHRAWAGARGALERTDQRRAYFLGRAAHAAGRSDGAPENAEPRQKSAARAVPARCRRICDRRHDLAVQGGDRGFLQGDREAAARRHPYPFWRAGDAARRRPSA